MIMNKFLTVAIATTLLASPAIAEDKKVTVPTPKSITITCSDDVRPGTLVLSNPPKFSCKDYDLAKDMIGTGITVGPTSNVNRIMADLRRVNRKTATSPIYEPTVRCNYRNKFGKCLENGPSVVMDNTWKPFPSTSLDDFDKKFPGMNRNRKFFVSDSITCHGWVSVSRILNGECSDAKVRTAVSGGHQAITN